MRSGIESVAAPPPLLGPGGGSITAASRRGPAHGQNEDRWGLLGADDLLLLAVADGMGGTAGGGTAAGIALRTLLEFADTQPDPPTGPEPTVSEPADPTGSGPTDSTDWTGPSGPSGPSSPSDLTVRSSPPDLTVPTDPTGSTAPASTGSTKPADLAGPATPDSTGLDSTGAALLAAMARAHHRVRAAAPPGLPDALRPGSTLTAAVVLGDRLVVGHVGDSACWLLRRGVLIRLTEEHTHAAVLVAAGAVERGSPAARRLDNLLTRHLGMPGELRPQLAAVRLQSGDRLLLATDGLSRALPPAALAALLARPETTAGRLVGAAVAVGAKDDVTAVLATIGDPASGYAAAVGVAAGAPNIDSAATGDGRCAGPAGHDERQIASGAGEPGPRAAAGR